MWGVIVEDMVEAEGGGSALAQRDAEPGVCD